VTVTVKVQIIMSTIEVLLLVLFAALALFHAHHVTPSRALVLAVNFLRSPRESFIGGALIAAFYYWGWTSRLI